MKNEINNALNCLRNGGVILYPTDTIWGLGCDATNTEAILKIHKIKKSKISKSMLILVSSINMLYSYVDIVPEIALDLIELSEKPLTIIYPDAKNISQELIANDGSIGIRVTKDLFCVELINKLKKPIVSTSANISNSTAPGYFSEIDNYIINAVDYVVNFKQNDTSNNNASSIIKLGLNGEIKIIRK